MEKVGTGAAGGGGPARVGGTAGDRLPLEEARKAVGPTADALAMDRVVRATASSRLGWRPAGAAFRRARPTPSPNGGPEALPVAIRCGPGGPMDRDLEQLRLLSIFHYVLAGIAGLSSLFPSIWIGLGVYMATNGPRQPGLPPPLFGWAMAVLGAALVVCGLGFTALVIAAARALRARRHHTFCVVVGALGCGFFPFGTVLGVFTILVLARPSVRARFEGDAAGLAER